MCPVQPPRDGKLTPVTYPTTASSVCSMVACTTTTSVATQPICSASIPRARSEKANEGDRDLRAWEQRLGKWETELRKTEVKHLEIVRDKARLESYTQTVEARLNEATSTIQTITHENELLRINTQPNSNSTESNGNVNSNSNMTDSNVNSSNVGNHGQASHSPANNPVTVIINNNGEKESPLH
jgi:hypothetical protein